MERSLAPVIIFSFSRKECEAYALQTSKLEFNSGNSTSANYILKLLFFYCSLAEEKALVEEVFNNAIDVLSDEDKKLPQVMKCIH